MIVSYYCFNCGHQNFPRLRDEPDVCYKCKVRNHMTGAARIDKRAWERRRTRVWLLRSNNKVFAYWRGRIEYNGDIGYESVQVGVPAPFDTPKDAIRALRAAVHARLREARAARAKGKKP